ncbi:hypothetical protein Gorai_015010 [Gossypium raimondii]|uniref:Pectin acetylesterase n=1 Tax=Gossypium raimondii TaxID=29730 RepID=A0A7J8P4K7_GOSRA|nr:hypothetical protein [Gossypium raimondii]
MAMATCFGTAVVHNKRGLRPNYLCSKRCSKRSRLFGRKPASLPLGQGIRNRIKVRYCDGSSFTGDVAAVNPVTNLHFRGARVWLAVMEDLLSKGMRNAENAILSGCSAGGLASILHCDSFRALLPMGTKVKCISDAGYFINTRDVSGGHYIQTFFDQLVATHGSAKNLLPSCTSRMKPGLVSAFCFLTSFTLHCNFQYSDQYSIHISQCFFPQNIAQQIRTPLFIINAAYDSWQIRNILAPGIADPHGHWESCKLDIKNCLPSQIKVMQGD